MKVSPSATAAADWPRLNTSYKQRFGFRLATTSFVYPADYDVNVRLLAPCLDEIELLMFESTPPSCQALPEVVQRLQDIQDDVPVGFNVHLPLDIALGSSDPAIRRQSIAGVQQVMEHTRVLNPSTYTLHLDYGQSDSPARRRDWCQCLDDSLQAILPNGISGRALSIENLDYPLEWVQPLIEAYDLSVCLDLGHLLRYGYDLPATFAHFAERISIMHLHGVNATGRDHIGLNHLSGFQRDLIQDVLRCFGGVVSLEVFDFEELRQSLHVLTHMAGISGGE